MSMNGVGEYVVVYDISCDRERRRVDKTLKGFGFRVQKSVFECRLRRKDRTALVERLKKLNIQTGFVKLYRQEYSTQCSAVVCGVCPQEEADSDAAFIV